MQLARHWNTKIIIMPLRFRWIFYQLLFYFFNFNIIICSPSSERTQYINNILYNVVGFRIIKHDNNIIIALCLEIHCILCFYSE